MCDLITITDPAVLHVVLTDQRIEVQHNVARGTCDDVSDDALGWARTVMAPFPETQTTDAVVRAFAKAKDDADRIAHIQNTVRTVVQCLSTKESVVVTTYAVRKSVAVSETTEALRGHTTDMSDMHHVVVYPDLLKTALKSAAYGVGRIMVWDRRTWKDLSSVPFSRMLCKRKRDDAR